MSQWDSIVSMGVFLAVFAVIFSLGVLIFLRAYGDKKKAIDRLRAMGDDAPPPLPVETKSKPMDAMPAFLPRLASKLFMDKETQLAPVKAQLLQAGFYHPNALGIFLGFKLGLMLALPVLAAAIPYAMGVVSVNKAIVISLSASAVGMIAPGLWLEREIAKRHRILRHSLPDALDMLVLCLEGGVSMASAFQRVTSELRIVHPVLGDEMSIMQREIQLGLSAGEALKKMAERCGLNEVRDLASVWLQSERFGASMVKALKTHAETGRQERHQQIEELAQKAAVKIIFPTLLCIFPAIFIVLLGPAAFQMAALFAK
jgi:tight adherence protein C